MVHRVNEAELNERKTSPSYQGSQKCRRLKKNMKDKCLVIGETTMYYGNFGSVQVHTPIPGSPNLDIAAESMNTRPDTPKQAAVQIQPKQQVTSKNNKGKKSTSQKKTITPKDKKSTSPTNQLPPLRVTPAVSSGRCPTRSSRGREPCSFQPSADIERRGNDLVATDKWIPQPGFKPREKKTSSNVKYGTLGTSLEPVKRVLQVSSSVVTASSDSVRLPAIRGATRGPGSPQTISPTAQYIDIYRDNDQLPPVKVRSMAIADKEFDREYHKLTKGYRR